MDERMSPWWSGFTGLVGVSGRGGELLVCSGLWMVRNVLVHRLHHRPSLSAAEMCSILIGNVRFIHHAVPGTHVESMESVGFGSKLLKIMGFRLGADQPEAGFGPRFSRLLAQVSPPPMSDSDGSVADFLRAPDLDHDDSSSEGPCDFLGRPREEVRHPGLAAQHPRSVLTSRSCF
jgi:hypothetical protein